MINRERFWTELKPSGFPMESLIWIKEQSNDCPNFYYVKTLLNPNIRRNSDTPLKSMEQLK